MPKHFPALLQVEGKTAVVVGGGAVSQRKIGALLKAGALVTVIAPNATAAIQEWAAQGTLSWLKKRYASGDIAGAWLVIIGTDNPAVNRQVLVDARAFHVLVNAADNAEACDFIVPAVVDGNGFTLAISTGSGSPAFARYVREGLERAFGKFSA